MPYAFSGPWPVNGSRWAVGKDYVRSKMLVENVVNSRRYGKIVLATVVRMAWVNESGNQCADWLTRA